MRGDRLRVMDILDAVAVIQRDMPINRQLFDSSPTIQSHILLHIQIIGEVASKISQNVRDGNAHIPWKPIIRMRNIIAHVYFGIDWNEVWEVAVRDLDILKPQIEALLSSLASDS